MFFFKRHRGLTVEGDTQWIGKNAVALATIACIILTRGEFCNESLDRKYNTGCFKKCC